MNDSLSRERAKFALRELRSCTRLDEVNTRLKGLPVEIRVQGLSMAVATLLRDNKAASRHILGWIRTWLTDESPVRVLEVKGSGHSALLEAVTMAERDVYLAAQRDVLGLVEQLKVLSDALVEGREKTDAVARVDA